MSNAADRAWRDGHGARLNGSAGDLMLQPLAWQAGAERMSEIAGIAIVGAEELERVGRETGGAIEAAVRRPMDARRAARDSAGS